MGVVTNDDGEMEITLVRGDTDDFLVTVTDDATPTPNKINLSQAVDGTASRNAVVRFAVKSKPEDQDNTEALCFKHSAFDDEIPFLVQAGATLGQCRVLLDKPDTEEGDPDLEYRWDIEVTRQDILRTAASGGTVSMVAGSAVITGVGTAFQNAKVGDVFQPLGVLNAGKPAIVQSVASATSMTVDHSNFQTEPGVTFEVRRGKHKTAARGPFVLQSGVVAV